MALTAPQSDTANDLGHSQFTDGTICGWTIVTGWKSQKKHSAMWDKLFAIRCILKLAAKFSGFVFKTGIFVTQLGIFFSDKLDSIVEKQQSLPQNGGTLKVGGNGIEVGK